MTNLLVTLLITTHTNWTGMTDNGQELGYVFTNHTAKVVYAGRTNETILKKELSSVAIWRPEAAPVVYNTGVFLWHTNGWTLTNYTVINRAL